MKIYDPENLADYIWWWCSTEFGQRWKYQFMDEPTVYNSITDLMHYLDSEGYLEAYVHNMKVELAKKKYIHDYDWAEVPFIKYM